MLNNGTFSFGNFLLDVFAIFMFVLWFWLLIMVIGDLFRRHDISGFGKAMWAIALILIPYFTVFIYVIIQSRGIAERRMQQDREGPRHVVGYSVADEIEKLERLKSAGTISNEEYIRLRARAMQ